MSDPVIYAAEAPENEPFWRDGAYHCPNADCQANLEESGAIAFTERYEAILYDGVFGKTIHRADVDFCTEACCRKCGMLINYDDVE